MGQRRFIDLAGKHTGYLDDAVLTLHGADSRTRQGGIVLGHMHLAVGDRGYLRQVGDDDDLVTDGKLVQPLRHKVRGDAAYTGIHLVEDEGRVAPVGRHRPLECQHDT